MSAVPAVIQQAAPPSLLAKIAARYSVEPAKMLTTLKQTAFRVKDGEVSNEQMMALLIVADQYKLNPFTKEIYAFPDRNAGIVPVVGIDGWARIMNEHPHADGIEFVDGPAGKDGMPEWIEAVIYRKDRKHPTRAREYMAECKRNVIPWQTHPRRMLRHKAMIQGARIAFGFVGIYDDDEAQRIAEASVVSVVPANQAVAAINAAILPPQQPASAAESVAPAPDAAPAEETPPAPASQAASASAGTADDFLAQMDAAEAAERQAAKRGK
jgi:phage recombination protein Bet